MSVAALLQRYAEGLSNECKSTATIAHLDVVYLGDVLVVARLLPVEGPVEDDDEPVVGHHEHELVWLRVVDVGLGDVDVYGQLFKPLPELEAAGGLSPSPSRPGHV